VPVRCVRARPPTVRVPPSIARWRPTIAPRPHVSASRPDVTGWRRRAIRTGFAQLSASGSASTLIGRADDDLIASRG